MPPTYCPCPRPILKRGSTSSPDCLQSTTAKDEPAQLMSIDPSVLCSVVRFPPTPTLTRTFLAHSPAIYDRTPIVVAPNKCKLPERGCPGRTYLPGEEPSPKKCPKSRSSSPTGRHLHPKAVKRIGHDESKPAHTQPLPALVHDSASSSSSSESDDSDSFSTPPLESATIASYPSSYPASSPASPRSPGLSIPLPPVDLSLPPMYLSRTPSSPLAFRTRNYSSISATRPTSPCNSRSSSPSRSRALSPCASRAASPATSRSSSPARALSPDAPRRKRTSSRSKRKSSMASPVSPSEVETNFKSFSERSTLTSCALSVPDVGCFGGF